jgi:hypothetical protein
MIRMKKIKLTSDKKISMAYEKQNKAKGWDEYSFTCSEEARPEFYTTVKSLAPHVLDLCELPDSYMDRIEVRGVSFSYGGEEEVMGATISAQMKLNYSNCSLNLNTPHKASASYSGGEVDDMQVLSDKCIKALDVLTDECQLYIDGDRAQGRLFEVA